MRLFLDKSPKWQYAVLSMHKDSRLAVELESSFDAKWQAESMFDNCYSKWGLTDQNFYLVDWRSQTILKAHEVFSNECTQILTNGRL